MMLIIDENLLEIDDLLELLVRELLNAPTFLALKKAKAVVENNQELQGKLVLLSENQDYLPYRPELRELQKELIFDEQIYQMRLAENDLQEILSKLTKQITSAISENIFVDENLPLKGEKKHGHHEC